MSGDFFEMPAVCIDAIHLINQGEPLDKIERQLEAQYPEEEVALVGLLNSLWSWAW